MKDREKYMTLDEAAIFTGLKKETIRRRFREGAIKGTAIGNEILIDRQSVNEYKYGSPWRVGHNKGQHTAKQMDPLELPEEPEEEPNPIDEFMDTQYHTIIAPGLEHLDEMDPVVNALIDTAWKLFANAAELLVKAGYRAKEIDDDDVEVQA